jgi:hypothetical protein
MKHRHLTHHRLTLAAIDDILENGTLADWRPLLARVRRDPEGQVARHVQQILDARDLEEVDAFWRAYLADARARRQRLPIRAGSHRR